MSNVSINLTDDLYDYLLRVSLREDEALRLLREETMNIPEHNMQISPEQGQFMRFMVQLINAKKGLEIGVFTGYSALSVALGLPDDGRLIALDISEEWTGIGKKYWQKAGVAHKIDLRIAPALQTLEALHREGQDGTFDFAFMDADKENYHFYYEHCLKLIRVNGLLFIDNVLWGGKVMNPSINDQDTRAIRALNEQLLNDERVDISMLPVSDGLTLVRKK